MNKLNELMQKEMTRKEFIATVGFGVASLFGLSAILRLLGKENPLNRNDSLGYGSGAYGGSRKTS
jgi:hypothetical protein